MTTPQNIKQNILQKIRKINRIFWKIMLWGFVSIFSLIFLLIIIIQFPRVQNFLVNQVEYFLYNKLKTRVEVGYVGLAFTKSLVLENVFVEDQKHDTILYCNELGVKFNLWKLFDKQMEVYTISLDGLTAKIARPLPDSTFNFQFIINELASTDTVTAHEKPTEKVDSTATSLNIKNLREIFLSNVHLQYVDEVSGIKTDNKIGQISLQFNTFDVNKNRFHLQQIEIDNSDINLSLLKPSEPTEKDTTTSSPIIYDIECKNILVKNFNLNFADIPNGMQLVYHFNYFSFTPEEIDLIHQHIDLKSIILDNSSLTFIQNKMPPIDSSKIVKTIKNDTIKTPMNWIVQLKELNIKDFNCEYHNFNFPKLSKGFDANHLTINNFQFQLHNIYFSEKQMAVNIENLAFSSPQGIDLQHLAANIAVDTNKTSVNELIINYGKTNIETSLSARYKSLENIADGIFDIKIKQCNINLSDFKPFLPDSLFPAGITIPQQFNLLGTVQGNIKNLKTDLQLNTALGSILCKTSLQNIDNDKLAKYDVAVDIRQLQVGKLLQMDSTTRISLSTKISGTGYDLPTMAANVALTIDSAFYNDYNFSDLTFNGEFKDKFFAASGYMLDDNLNFDIALEMSINDSIPEISFSTKIKTLHLKPLHFYSDNLSLEGKISAQFSGLATDNFDAFLNFRELNISDGKNSYPLEGKINMTSKPNFSGIELKTNIADVSFQGNIPLLNIGTTIEQHINQYFTISDSLPVLNIADYDFTFAVKPKNLKILSGMFVPELQKFDSKQISGRYDGSTNNLSVNAQLPYIQYDSMFVHNFNFVMNSNASQMNYELKIDSVSDGYMKIPNITLAGNLKDNNLRAALVLLDDMGDRDFVLDGILNVADSTYTYHFVDSGFVMNREIWTVSPDNSIVFTPSTLNANNLILKNYKQEISLNTIYTASELGFHHTETTLNFTSFGIDNLLDAADGIIPKDDIITVRGALSGNVKLFDFPQQMKFTSDLKIENFVFVFRKIGDIYCSVSNLTNPDRYDIKAGLQGLENNFGIEGYYDMISIDNPLNFNINVENLQASTIEYWLTDYLSNLSGRMDGKIQIGGSPTLPKINGNLHFNQTGFASTSFKANLLLMNEEMLFDDKGIHFHNFAIQDEKNNKAVIDGSLLTTDFMNFNFDLSVKGDNLTVLNSTEKDNPEYYGELVIGTDLKITGDVDHTIVDGDLKIQKGTDLTYVTLNSATEVRGEGMVEFVKIDSLSLSSTSQSAVKDSIAKKITGIDLNTNIEIEHGSKFNIKLDAYTGDEIEVNAYSTMSFSMNTSGNMNLAGKFEIDKGFYYMPSFKKRFVMQPGSYLDWGGDPYNPTLNLTAIYTVKTSPLNLLADEIAGMDESQKKQFNKRLPFQVALNIGGEANRPQMSFSINLPKDEQGALNGSVQSKLQKMSADEASVNKQAISLLVIGNFIPEGNTEGGGFNTAAYTYQLVSDELNQFAAKYIKQVDLNFDIQAYNDYGTTDGTEQLRKEMKIQASKKLFRERLDIQVGGLLLLQGDERDQASNDRVDPNILLQYKITKDGRYAVKAYQESVYTGLLEGQLLERGVSFVYTREFDKVREVFMRPKKVKVESEKINKSEK